MFGHMKVEPILRVRPACPVEDAVVTDLDATVGEQRYERRSPSFHAGTSPDTISTDAHLCKTGKGAAASVVVASWKNQSWATSLHLHGAGVS